MRQPVRLLPSARHYMRDQETKFMTWYDEHNDAIFRHCYYRLYDREKALEITQETFLRLWRELVRGTTIEYSKPLLYRIATNLIIDTKRKKTETSLEDIQEKGFEPAHTDTTMIGTIEFSYLEHALTELDDDERQLLILRYVDGCKTGEISEILGETTNVISVRLHRAKKKCKHILKKKGYL